MKKLFCLCCLIFSLGAYTQKKASVVSPDGNIVFNFYLLNENAVYNVSYKKNRIIDNSKLSLDFTDGSFENNLRMNKAVYNDSVEDYDLVVGKTKHVHDAYNEVTIPLHKQQVDQQKNKFSCKGF